MLVGACESDVMPDSHGIQAWVGAYAYENYTDPPLVQRFDNASKVHAAVRGRFAVVSSLLIRPRLDFFFRHLMFWLPSR